MAPARPFRTPKSVRQWLPCLVVTLWAACSPSTAPEAGKSAGARRVVSLAPALTAIVDALGAKDRLVGVTRFCDMPGVPVVGDLEPRAEAILATHPELVLMARYGSQGEAAARLRALGLDVRELALVTLDDMRAATLAVGEITDTRARAQALIDAFDAAVADARARAVSNAPVKVLLVYDLQPGIVVTTGGGDHVSELLAIAGGVNIAAPGPVTMRLGLEEVLHRAPDVILHAAPDDRFPDDARARAYWASFPDVPAVRRGAVYVWPDSALARNGPHLAPVVKRLSDLFAGTIGPAR